MNVVVYYHFDVYLGISFCSYKRSVDLKLLACSQILEVAGSNDSGRLLFATSWSPSLRSGITSDIFQADGKTEVCNERFIMSVITGSL